MGCCNKMQAKMGDHQPSRRSTKAAPCQKESALRIAEVVELLWPRGVEGQVPTPPYDDSEVAESNYENDPLVGGLIDPIMVPLELSILGSGKKVTLAALLDSGCTCCLISPKLVGKMGAPLRRLETPIAFCQLDGSFAWGIPASFAARLLNLVKGSHSETLAPGMEMPLVLGLAWLKKWNHIDDWREGCLKFPNKRAPLPSKDENGRREPHRELASALSEQDLPSLSPEYQDLAKVFSEQRLDELPPH